MIDPRTWDDSDAPVLLRVLLGAMAEPVQWMDLAACAETDPEAFFPEKGGSSREAKAVCMACHVRPQCLEYALENDERFGIFGGLSERQRRAVKRARERRAA